MARVRWVVLGAGGIARRRTIPEGIIPADNAELVAVYDPVNLDEIARAFDARACNSEAELLAQDCDAVYIATPVHLHCAQVKAAARSGKHVLCEKPLGLTVAQAEDMVSACGSAGVKLGVGLLMRFHAHHCKALELVEGGRIGQPVLGRAQLSCWYPPIEGAWRQDPELGGGGSLMDMGCHCIDLLEMFFGRTTSVFCSTARLVHDYTSEDTATVLLEFASGARGIVDNLFNVPDHSSRNRLELYGSAGSILAEGTIGQDEAGDMTLYEQADAGGYEAQQSRDPNAGERIAPTPINTYRAQIEAFSQAILDDTQPPIDGEHGLWSQRVLAACYESARSGRRVSLA